MPAAPQGACLAARVGVGQRICYPSCQQSNKQLYARSWPPEAFVFSGATEHMPDGRLVFRGPRLATAVHETVEYRCGWWMKRQRESAPEAPFKQWALCHCHCCTGLVIGFHFRVCI